MIPFSDECPEHLRDAVKRVWRSFTAKEKRFFNSKSYRFTITCDDEQSPEYGGCLGKVFVNFNQPVEPDYYFLNIWPSTLDEAEDDLLFVIAHEFGHLDWLLNGNLVDNEEFSEELADEFAYCHGFAPKNLSLLTKYSKERASPSRGRRGDAP